MRIIVKSLIILFIQAHNLLATGPDSLLYTSHVFDENIRTVQLYREGWNLSYPIIKLGGDEKLELNFDLLGDRIETYYYTFIHCDKDWKQSGIYPNEYLEGFPENPLEDYRRSFNTTVRYVHYSLVFPNDRIMFRFSGNYIIMIFPAGEPDKPVLTQRFIITEDRADISMQVHRPRMTADRNAGQQVDLTVNHSKLRINDPYRDIFVSILQNGRWKNASRNLKPEFYGNNELRYSSLSDKNVFLGGNEFRYFDIKSIRYKSEYVRQIEFLVSNYHVYLLPSEDREFKPYFYWQDFNGKYYVAIQEEKNPATDADYVYVYFTLPSKYPVEGGRIYVSGAFNNWEYDSKNLMTFNPVKEAYECAILLKQGWYNYEYFFTGEDKTDRFAAKFEGSHYETENDYTAIVYYRNPLERFDRVIGSGTINTLNRITD